MDSSLTKDIAYANELYAEQVAHLKHIYALKEKRVAVRDGTDQAHSIDDQIADTERLLELNNKIIQQLDGQAIARSKLVNLGKEEARLMQRQDTKSYSGANEIAQAQKAYTQLTSSIKSYNAAVKSGNEAGQAYWSQSAQQAAAELESIEAKLGTLRMEEDARKKILDLIQKGKDANLNADAQGLHDTVDKIGNKLVQMLVVATALKALKSIWKNAIDYGKQYYDLLNEIRIVSGQTQKQADDMGKAYRKMAKDMNVSSTEIAKAAVEFYRQGLPEDETNKRLTATIQYAKISAMSFDDAAQLMTSATNTMEVSAERVASVWAFLGDESASG